ncbi:helix-turn-helix domain-containing protein [Sinomicrobium soli]|uniref:helix-turn-helix domain-containing protein n=1 Tax=Sinomicrobium sp. N-1-3-6 TaxID=2219864 RepID=UPI000DCBAB08|nr:AraC family transcriptional regulator [Sinomicrobium sp. N-1-3-6]RAV27542.1 AraC family transcriptional regulator [Sinomicrobium sp. N-1-3-6]
MKPYHLKTIREFHELHQLKSPLHPLISIVNYAEVAAGKHENLPQATFADYYSISKKRGLNGKMRYGQQDYDYNEGVMYFMAPGQVLHALPKPEKDEKPSGWILLIHPDFLWGTALADHIRHYEFFDYEANEALFLSEREETIINQIIRNIEEEYSRNIDQYSQKIIVSQLETMLQYSERFYNRQFITRQKSGHEILNKLEHILNAYFSDENPVDKRLPTVRYLSGQLHISPGYLGSLLRNLTGISTQQVIQNKVIEMAKLKLSTTDLSVSQIAYELGFEHSQSFSKLFRQKTNQSPMEFRAGFN